MPELHGKKSFRGVALHSKEFGESKFIASEELRHIVGTGAGKSYDLRSTALWEYSLLDYSKDGCWSRMFRSYRPEDFL
ncbi:putative dimethylaniline protein [Botrytis fragariae]|uniref:Putative dimethylaniline protein n=1 Tax=Botrytis fragariae TaxID=1964551 RepID=A0A8H6AUW4_9HELO|nr:putative dimethylaniline protein [Botrytis fragariae]KAF5874018.1 putative dimethylaniline protein [Botrytis fragariae]